jgi:hypothetical protein
VATQIDQRGHPRPHCGGNPSHCREADIDRPAHAHRPDVHRSFDLDRFCNRATSKAAVVIVLMDRLRPIGVVESTSSSKKVLTNARKHRSIHSLERTAFTHWTAEKFVRQATDRPLAELINEVGKGGWYE